MNPRAVTTDLLLGSAPIALLILIWQALVSFGHAPATLLPPPGLVFQRLARQLVTSTFEQDVAATLFRLFAGFLIAVVLGASSGTARAVRAAQMLDRGFGANGLGWLKPSLGSVDQLAPIDASPPNLRDDMCSGKRHHPASDEDDTTASDSTSGAQIGSTFLAAGLQQPSAKPADLMAAAPAPSEPILVYTGPTRTGAALIAAVAADTESQTVHRGKKGHGAGKKLAATAEPKDGSKDGNKSAKADKTAKGDTKPTTPMRHANAAPKAADKAADKPAATDAAAAKPAKPKAAAKPKTSPGSTGPGGNPADAKPKSTSG